MSAAQELTHDDFLGGKLRLTQPARGYRAGVDAVMLAASAEAGQGARVLELGAGTGAVLCCLARRRPDLDLTGVERNPDYAALAEQNLAENGLKGQVITGDFTSRLFGDNPRFDEVLANPPYFVGGSQAADDGRRTALHEETPLGTWIDTGRKLLRPGGRMTVIHRAERLGEILAGYAKHFGKVQILPLQPRLGRPATLVLVRATRDSRAGATLLAPFTLHSGEKHTGNRNDYTAAARAIMWDGAALPWGADT